LADDPYRFGFCAPSDFMPEEPPDEFKRCPSCGGWYDDPHPHERPQRRELTEAEQAELRRPYDPETDPF
jgi:hypothetical protein